MNFLRTYLEPGMVPGPGLSAVQTILIFVIAPIGLFVGISLVAYAGSYDRSKKKRSPIEHID